LLQGSVAARFVLYVSDLHLSFRFIPTCFLQDGDDFDAQTISVLFIVLARYSWRPVASPPGVTRFYGPRILIPPNRNHIIASRPFMIRES
jgi:hypothetical protein